MTRRWLAFSRCSSASCPSRSSHTNCNARRSSAHEPCPTSSRGRPPPKPAALREEERVAMSGFVSRTKSSEVVGVVADRRRTSQIVSREWCAGAPSVCMCPAGMRSSLSHMPIMMSAMPFVINIYAPQCTHMHTCMHLAGMTTSSTARLGLAPSPVYICNHPNSWGTVFICNMIYTCIRPISWDTVFIRKCSY